MGENTMKPGVEPAPISTADNTALGLENALSGAEFDGIICIGGEDWWYHNRGHFDFQIMRRLAKRWPVLFVNSLGVRMPSLSDKGLFAKRIGRKLKSFSRGVTNVENKFWVFSPLSVPGEAVRKFNASSLSPQIRLAAFRAGIRKPLLWVHCPAGVDVIDSLPHTGLVFQRTDRFESFPEGDPVVLKQQVDTLRARADLVVYAAPHLQDEECQSVKRSLLVTHGVDVERFRAAGAKTQTIGPRDIAHLKRPRVGFIGGIDAHTFDPDLFLSVAGMLPDHQFILVGGCSLQEDWCQLENVRAVGRKPYEVVADYMAAMDCLIMPWNRSEWIAACNPIKLKEYLAVGRPVVSRPFQALKPYEGVVRVADDAATFASAVREACVQPYDGTQALALVAQEDWDAKVGLVADALCRLHKPVTDNGEYEEARTAA
ncbi:MAG: glycosyltransferase [Pseudomonadota bacterium]